MKEELQGKTVFLLADFSLPFGRIAPTLKKLLDSGAKVVIGAFHPDPAPWGGVHEDSLEPYARKFADFLGRKFIALSPEQSLPDYAVPHLFFLKHEIDKHDVRDVISQMHARDLAVLERLNNYNETAAAEIPKFSNLFVHDDFGHESALVSSLGNFLPPKAGLAAAETRKKLESFIRVAKHPFVMVLGGVNLAGKEQALSVLFKKADKILIGGALANLFLSAKGYPIGKSIVDKKVQQKIVKAWLRDYAAKIVLPTDVIVSPDPQTRGECVSIAKVKAHHMILDIGPATILNFSREIKKAKTLLWSGPLGYVESRNFSAGTEALLRLFAARTGRPKAAAVAGGGKTMALATIWGLADFLDHVHSKGSAMLNFLAKLK